MSEINRRSLAKGVAWTAPAVALASAAPAVATSVDQDCIIDSSCYGLNILGVGMSFPKFTITAVGAPILAGSTFTLTGSGIKNLTFGGPEGFCDFNFLHSSEMTVTLKKTIPAGGSCYVKVTGLLSKQVKKKYTLAVKQLLGNTNSKSTLNDAASNYLSGVSVLGVLIGYCGTDEHHKVSARSGSSNEEVITAMSAAERRDLIGRIEALR